MDWYPAFSTVSQKAETIFTAVEVVIPRVRYWLFWAPSRSKTTGMSSRYKHRYNWDNLVHYSREKDYVVNGSSRVVKGIDVSVFQGSLRPGDGLGVEVDPYLDPGGLGPLDVLMEVAVPGGPVGGLRPVDGHVLPGPLLPLQL